MPIVAQTYRHVLGVDTHACTHTAALIESAAGTVVETRVFPVTRAGLARLVHWVTRTDPDPLLVIEGVGSYGATLRQQAEQAGLKVVEPSLMPLRQSGKTDEIDAARIGRSVLDVDTSRLRQPRDDQGLRAAVRVLVVDREQVAADKTRAVNVLTGLLRTVDLDIDARHPLTMTQIRQVASWRDRQEPTAAAIIRRHATRWARRIIDLDTQLFDNTRELKALLPATPVAVLLNQPGIGPVVAADIYIAWSHKGRVRSEAAFAALAGVCPRPVSSGNTNRHRLNRGGDRRLNRAIYTIALTRLRCDPATKAYAAKQTAQGHTIRDTRRMLKRYIARDIWRTLNRADET